jgi:hypothetical protein
MDTEEPHVRVYLYNHNDMIDAAARSAQQHVLMRVNQIDVDVSQSLVSKPFTRYVDMKKAQYEAIMDSGGVSGIARTSDGEKVIAVMGMQKTMFQTSDLVSPVEFIRQMENKMSNKNESSLSM